MVDPAIANRFDQNLARVTHLVSVYEGLSDPGQGRRPVNSSDILRAATVFLHASLEDALRSLELLVLPNAAREEIDKVPLKGLGLHGQKFLLGDLLAHRGIAVDDLIHQSVAEYLERRSYNSSTEVDTAIRRLRIDPAPVRHLYSDLEEMIARRHHIVHQADRHDVHGHGHHKAKSIGLSMIRRWITCVHALVRRVFDDFVP
jgi:hypothetical protein